MSVCGPQESLWESLPQDITDSVQMSLPPKPYGPRRNSRDMFIESFLSFLHHQLEECSESTKAESHSGKSTPELSGWKYFRGISIPNGIVCLKIMIFLSTSFKVFCTSPVSSPTPPHTSIYKPAFIVCKHHNLLCWKALRNVSEITA